jgi:hypothetical protein
LHNTIAGTGTQEQMVNFDSKRQTEIADASFNTLNVDAKIKEPALYYSSNNRSNFTKIQDSMLTEVNAKSIIIKDKT